MQHEAQGDLQNLSCPPFTFVPNDFSMYDVTVAVDEVQCKCFGKQGEKSRGSHDFLNKSISLISVSYTHLTLPTKLEV